MKTKLFNYIALILLTAIIGIFIHSEIVSPFHNDESHVQYDYCNLVSNTIQPQQNEFQKINFAFYGILPLIQNFSICENTVLTTFTVPYTPIANISRTILFESFLI